jgi:mycothiol system anti-sigma-R factor
MDAHEECIMVLARMHAFLDGECDEREADDIRHHLDACESCLESVEVAAALKALVRRCCCEPTAPDDLRAKLLSRYGIQSVCVEYTEVRTTELHVEGLG